MFDPKKFTTTKAKPLPVYLLLDVSTTMGEIIDPENARRTGETFFRDGKEWEIVEGGISKMDQLNEAVREMLESFAEAEKMEIEILVSIITFGDDAYLYLSPTKASKIKWKNIGADGETALGASLKMAKAMIEDKETTPSRAYRPLIVLVSDGQPNDDWELPLDDFINEGRSSKCHCMAMAIGHDADEEVLNRFIENTPILDNKPNKLFYAENASQINDFFEFVTMTATNTTIKNISKPDSKKIPSKNDKEVPNASKINLDGATRAEPESNSKGSKQAETTPDDDNNEGYW